MLVDSDKYDGGGIYRNVWLTQSPKVGFITPDGVCFGLGCPHRQIFLLGATPATDTEVGDLDPFLSTWATRGRPRSIVQVMVRSRMFDLPRYRAGRDQYRGIRWLRAAA